MSDLDLASVSATLDHLSMTLAARTIVNDLLAEVERLRANQLPDGGKWRDEYWRVGTLLTYPMHSQRHVGDTHRRRVWTGPPEPLSDVLATPDPDSDTQTAV